jgi:hypothetical protein
LVLPTLRNLEIIAEHSVNVVELRRELILKEALNHLVKVATVYYDCFQMYLMPSTRTKSDDNDREKNKISVCPGQIDIFVTTYRITSSTGSDDTTNASGVY